MVDKKAKIEEITRITGKGLEEVMLLTQFNPQVVDAYHYMIMTCNNNQT